MSTPPTPDPAYEIVLRETQRRVETPASDADLAAMHRGRRRLDHRAAEIVRLLDILKRAQKKLKSRHDALLTESEGIGQIADREKVERLVLCEVVHDARQGGVIFIRRKDTREVIPNSFRPLSAEERNVFADLKPQPDLIPGMSPTVDEELAKKLRLSEYLADAAPADIDVQIEEALAASALAPELQDALLTIEADADEEDAKPKAKKAKAPAEPKESKPKGKGGRKKKEPPPPPPPAEEPEAEEEEEEDAEPGPAEMEPDEPERPVLPRRPDAPRAAPQPPEDESAPEEEEEFSDEPAAGEAPESEEEDVAEGAAASAGAPEGDESEASAAGDDAASEDNDGGEPSAEDVGASFLDDDGGEPSAEDVGASFLDDDGDEPEAVASENAAEDASDEIPDYDVGGEEPSAAAPAEDPYPGAYDADGADAPDEWVDTSAPAPAPVDEPEPTPAAPPAPEPAPEPEPVPVAKIDEPAPVAAETATTKKARKKKGEESAAPVPEKTIEEGWVRGKGFPGGPLAHYDATSGPANITFTYLVYDEVDRTDAQPTAEAWAEAWKKEGALSVKLVPVVDPARAPKPPAPPQPTGQPELLPASERNVGNHFGLTESIAKRFGEAVIQQIKKGPFLASTAIASMERYFGAVMTQNMKLALLPVLEHMAGEGTIKRQVAGTDIIYYLTEPKEGFEAWRTAQRRK